MVRISPFSGIFFLKFFKQNLLAAKTTFFSRIEKLAALQAFFLISVNLQLSFNLPRKFISCYLGKNSGFSERTNFHGKQIESSLSNHF